MGLQHGRQLRTGRDCTAPEGPRTRFQEMEEILGRARNGLEPGCSAMCQAKGRG